MTAETTTNGHQKTDGTAAKKTTRRRSSSTRRHTNSRFGDALAHGDVAALSEGLSHHLVDMKDKGLQAADSLEKGIVKNPKSSVLVAFGVGYVLARLGRWL